MGKLTKARKRALEFVRDNEPVKLFPIGGPSLALINKMAREGLFIKQRPPAFGLTSYTLSHAGRLALSDNSPAGRSALEKENGGRG